MAAEVQQYFVVHQNIHFKHEEETAQNIVFKTSCCHCTTLLSTNKYCQTVNKCTSVALNRNQKLGNYILQQIIVYQQSCIVAWFAAFCANANSMVSFATFFWLNRIKQTILVQTTVKYFTWKYIALLILHNGLTRAISSASIMIKIKHFVCVQKWKNGKKTWKIGLLRMFE